MYSIFIFKKIVNPLDLDKKLIGVAVIVAALAITAVIVLSNNQPISKNSSIVGNGTIVSNATSVTPPIATTGRHLTVQINESMSVKANP